MSRRSDRGFALLIVLWTLALLALLGTQLVASGRGDAQLARNLLNAAELRGAADGAVQQAIFNMLLPPAQRWTDDGAVHVVRLGPAVVTLRIEDEDGKVNPNIASDSLMQALLIQVGADPFTAASVAAAIADWRSGTTQPRPLGAKAPQYAAAGRDYAPPGTDFRSIDEVGDVLGMTPDLLMRLRPHMTVYSDRDPDSTTRDPVVAAALGVPAQVGVATGPTLQVALVTADVRGPGNAAFAEQVVVRLSAMTARHPYEILSLHAIAPRQSPGRGP
jgi:general secretion pathway protein K